MPLSKDQIGFLIKKARQIKSEKIKKKFTQNDLAESLGKSRSYIGDIENGRTYPNYRLLANIAKICEVPLSFFDESNSLLISIIDKFFPDMNNEDQKDFAQYISKNLVDVNYGVVDWDIDIWKEQFEYYKRDLILQEAMSYSQIEDYEFKTAEAAMQFILRQPTIIKYGGFDINKMTNEDIIAFANELLNLLKMLAPKYNK